jgi:hypothetical protein
VALDVSKKEWQSSLKIFSHGGMSSLAAGNCRLNHDQQSFFALISEGESCRISTVRWGSDGARDNEEE